jgi:prephenate dehydratase
MTIWSLTLPDNPSRSSPSAPRVAFQGERGAFSEAAALQLLGNGVHAIPCPTFEAAFRAIPEGAADALLAPVENSLAGSVVRVFDLLLASDLEIVGETILRIAHQLIGCPGATLAGLRSVASHPVALAQCERFFLAHPELKRVPAEDTAGSVREVLARGDRSAAAVAGSRAAEHYGGAIIAENIHDNPENFTRFVLLVPASRESREHAGALNLRQNARAVSPSTLKMSLALRLAHKPGALLAALEPFARHEVNLLKIESRPIHGRPWEYQFFLDIESDASSKLEAALAEVRAATSELRVLGIYPPAL